MTAVTKVSAVSFILFFQNWFGGSTSSDNKEFTIKSPSYHLKAGNPVQLRFYIQYDVNQPVPSVAIIKLNGRVICNATDSNDSNNRGTSRPNVRPTSQRPQQQSNQNRPLNVDADSYVATDQQNEFNPAFGTSRPATSRPNKNTNQQSNSRPQQSNTRPTYQNQNNDYDSSRPSGGTNVNRPLNVDVDSYGTNQNEFAPAFGSVPDGNQYNQGSVSTDNNSNNR